MNGRYRFRGSLPDLRQLEPEAKPSDGSAGVRNVQSGYAVEILRAVVDLPEAQPGCCGRCGKPESNERNTPCQSAK